MTSIMSIMSSSPMESSDWSIQHCIKNGGKNTMLNWPYKKSFYKTKISVETCKFQ